VRPQASKLAMAASISALPIEDGSSDDKFFYAFVGLSVWAGLLGLVWPSVILWERLIEWRSRGMR
jgi:hypothetical protein